MSVNPAPEDRQKRGLPQVPDHSGLRDETLSQETKMNKQRSLRPLLFWVGASTPLRSQLPATTTNNCLHRLLLGQRLGEKRERKWLSLKSLLPWNCTHTHVHISHKNMHTCVHIHSQTQEQTYAHTYTQAHINIHTCAHAYTYPNTHTYICTFTSMFPLDGKTNCVFNKLCLLKPDFIWESEKWTSFFKQVKVYRKTEQVSNSYMFQIASLRTASPLVSIPP